MQTKAVSLRLTGLFLALCTGFPVTASGKAAPFPETASASVGAAAAGPSVYAHAARIARGAAIAGRAGRIRQD
ncbi:MAG: hypothetical protein ACFB6R_01660 [Alphaproteobacteria bacterium]